MCGRTSKLLAPHALVLVLKTSVKTDSKMSSSHPNTLRDAADPKPAEAENLQERIDDLSPQLSKANAQKHGAIAITRSLTNLNQANQTPSQPSKDQRRPHQPISEDVKNLIYANVCDGNMNQVQAASAFRVSSRQVKRIIKQKRDAENYSGSDSPREPKRKRGATSKLTVEMLVDLLLFLEEQPGLTLKKMVEFIEDRFKVSTSITAVDRALRKMDITWKSATTIPSKWNDPTVTSKRHDYARRRLNDGDPFAVYVDETGFDLHTQKSHPRAMAGKMATLTVVPRLSQITMIAAMSKEGYVYHELINSNGQRQRGVDPKDFSHFLIHLHSRCPQGAVIYLDGAPIHRGDEFEQARQTIEAAKDVKIDFLPPYSPFLNPIELSFDALKSFLKAQKIQTRPQLVNAVHQGIRELMTPTNCEGWFEHSKDLLKPASQGQKFTGYILEGT